MCTFSRGVNTLTCSCLEISHENVKVGVAAGLSLYLGEFKTMSDSKWNELQMMDRLLHSTIRLVCFIGYHCVASY